MPVQIQNSIDIEGFEHDLDRRVRSALHYIGQDLVREIRAYLDRENVNVEGDLKKSINEQVERFVNEFQLRVGPNMQHGIFVHEGTRPHWAPIGPIRNWVRKKLNLIGDEVDAAAYAIQQKIADEGTEPVPFMLDVYKQYQPTIIPLLIQRIGLS